MPLSFVQYPGDGVTETFAVPFPYLRQEDIEARVNLDVVPITFDDPSTVRISPAPANETVVEIRRSTKADEPLVNFVDASILTETDLNLIVRQTFFIVQEAIDIAGGTLELKANGAYGAGGRRLEDLADPVNQQDAVNLRYFNGTFLPQMQTLLSQTTNARNQAEGFRNETQTFHNAALGFRNEAETFRNAALGFRNEAETFRNQSQTSEQNAATSASTATTRRNEAEAARDAAQVAQGMAEGARDQGLIYRDATLGFRNEAETFRDQAEVFRNEAQTFDPAQYAPVSHTHAISEVTGLQAELNNKANKAGDTFTGNVTIQKPSAQLDIINDVDTLGGYLLETGSGFQIGTNSALRPLSFAVNNIEQMRLDSAGRLTNPNQPRFNGSPSVNYAFGGAPSGNIIFIAQINVGNCYNPSNGRFTAPVSGFYLTTWGGLQLTNGVSSLNRNGTRYHNGNHYNGPGLHVNMTQTVILYLNAGDFLNIEWWNGGGYHSDWFNWSVELVG